jgi:hypothetical protein
VYLGHGFQTQGTEREDHVQLGTIVARAGRKARSSLARSISLVSSSARLGSLENLNRAKLRFQLAMITSSSWLASRSRALTSQCRNQQTS